jgi:hypothetical protein
VNHYVTPNAAYTLLTTAPDYARFVAAVLAGRGLSRPMWQAFLTPQRPTGPGIAMGLGVRVEDAPGGRIFYHSGNNGRRFTCYMTGDLATNTGFVYFTGAPNGTSLVGALAARVFGPGRQARHHADFDRYDDPRLAAIRSVERAAAEQGADAARVRLRAIAADSATRPSFGQTLELGGFFAGRKLGPLSLEVLGRAAAEAPDSASARLALGRAEEAAGDLPAAIVSYRRALTLRGDTAAAGEQLRWAEARAAARARPARVPPRTLERYAGTYGEREVTLREGRLWYRRGANAASALVPMAADLFEVEVEPTLRVKFVVEPGAADRLIELSSDGSIEEAGRTSP